MSRQTPGWNAEYADLESETQALLNSVRKGPPAAAASSPKKAAAAKKKRGAAASPKRRGGRKRGGRATPKSGRSRSKSRQRRYDVEEIDVAPSDTASSAGPDDSFAGLIATATMNSTASTRGGSPHNGGGGGRRRRRRSSRDTPIQSRGSSSTNLEDSAGSEGGFSEIEPPASDRSSGAESGGSPPSAGESKRSSPPPSNTVAAAGDSVEAAAAKEQQERLEALERARAEEAKLRELSFRAEESRVREGLDGFIPHKVTQVATAVKELDAEKARLNELEGKMKAGGKQRLDNLQRRDRRVAEVKASTDIQRIVRGKFGRKRAHMKRKQMEMEAAGISLLPPLHPELPGPDPRDFGPSETPESGANTTNIDMDDQGYLVGGGGSRLPQLNFSSGKGGGGGRLQSFKVGRRRGGDGPGRPFSASSSLSSASSTASSDLDLDEAIPVERTPRLFLPDGSPDIKLRDTVRNALRVSRFDSVSTLLASGPLARKVKKGKERMEKKGGVRKSTADRVKGMHTPYRSGTGDQMGSPGKQKNGGKFVATVKGSAADAQSSGVMSPSQKGKKGKATGMSGPPAMYEVSHGGFDTGERTVDPNADDTASEANSDAGGAMVKKGGSSLKKSKGRKKKQVCFACWSAGDDMVKRCDLHEDDENAPDDGRDDSILMCGNWNVHALRRRYRAEELQEVFAKAVSSLRWDLNRKQFVTVIECRHPIYRMINGMLELLNKRKSRMDHARAWFKSILEDLRAGKIKGLSEKQKQKSKMLAAKDSMMNFAWTQRYAREVSFCFVCVCVCVCF
jgi:hypothetical protein